LVVHTRRHCIILTVEYHIIRVIAVWIWSTASTVAIETIRVTIDVSIVIIALITLAFRVVNEPSWRRIAVCNCKLKRKRRKKIVRLQSILPSVNNRHKVNKLTCAIIRSSHSNAIHNIVDQEEDHKITINTYSCILDRCKTVSHHAKQLILGQKEFRCSCARTRSISRTV
jgi:hypothetical protein